MQISVLTDGAMLSLRLWTRLKDASKRGKDSKKEYLWIHIVNFEQLLILTHFRFYLLTPRCSL